jgi:hypothetical protein
MRIGDYASTENRTGNMPVLLLTIGEDRDSKGAHDSRHSRRMRKIREGSELLGLPSDVLAAFVSLLPHAVISRVGRANMSPPSDGLNHRS